MGTVRQVQTAASAVAAGASALLAIRSLRRQLNKDGGRSWLKIAQRGVSAGLALASVYGAYRTMQQNKRTSSAA